jgi:integrase
MHRCGLRASRRAGCTCATSTGARASIRIRAEVAKGGREAVVYLDEPTLALLERWKDVRRQYAAGKPHLFTTLKGGPVGRKYVWEMVEPLRAPRRDRAAGLAARCSGTRSRPTCCARASPRARSRRSCATPTSARR